MPVNCWAEFERIWLGLGHFGRNLAKFDESGPSGRNRPAWVDFGRIARAEFGRRWLISGKNWPSSSQRCSKSGRFWTARAQAGSNLAELGPRFRKSGLHLVELGEFRLAPPHWPIFEKLHGPSAGTLMEQHNVSLPSPFSRGPPGIVFWSRRLLFQQWAQEAPR